MKVLSILALVMMISAPSFAEEQKAPAAEGASAPVAETNAQPTKAAKPAKKEKKKRTEKK